MDHDRAAATVPIAEIMTTDVVTGAPDRPVEEVARELRARGFGGLPVVDAAGAPVGMVSESDVSSRRGRAVAEIMTRDVVSVGDQTGAERVTALMGRHGIRRVPVVRDGRLVGVVSRSDRLRLFSLVRAAPRSPSSKSAGPPRGSDRAGSRARLGAPPRAWPACPGRRHSRRRRPSPARRRGRQRGCGAPPGIRRGPRGTGAARGPRHDAAGAPPAGG
jgi:CBS domain-containing protein